MTAERILISVPGLENLTVVAAMLRAANASITTGLRTFAVEGPLTPGQAAAVWRMHGHVDSGTEQNRLTVVTDPAGDLELVLDRLCPAGWSPDDYDDRHDNDYAGNDRWWRGQQRLKAERASAARNPTPPPPPAAAPAVVERRSDGTCCGDGGPWAPDEGAPLVGGCQLCPRSASYWRAAAVTQTG